MSTEWIDPSDPRWHYDEQWQQRAVALMHHLTGVRLTADLLASAVPDRYRASGVVMIAAL